ncbi:MAG: leucine--tRNA ligase [Planctomycetota bacterium]
MAGYDFAAIEKKWQAYWEQAGTFRQPNPGQSGFVDKPKLYVLDMFPYPSGAGLHVGHPEGYTASDIVARYARMKGYNVVHPMGYDSFGLPAQQYAVEHGIHPRLTTATNIANIERQIKSIGFSYDWSRRVATTDPEYYRWTQWIFLRMYDSWYDPKADGARPIAELIERLEDGEYLVTPDGDVAGNEAYDIQVYSGAPSCLIRWIDLPREQQREVIDAQRLAYMAEIPVNWCPALGTVLANEEVTNEGRSERGNHPVFRRALNQWMLRITAYAQRLLTDVEKVNWPESIKIMQRNWIGKSTGAEVFFPVADSEETIEVYTTRPDTLYGATYMVLSPEHPLVEKITTATQQAEVRAYVEQSARKSELERMAAAKEKTGVFTGAYAVNPVTEGRIPVWVADYVMMGYGTGAIMAVPGHDTRDFEFARKFLLPVVQVVALPAGTDWQGYVEDGTAVNSGPYDGLATSEVKKRITRWLEEQGLGKAAVNYRLRDWIFSRQWYWGEPFPIVHCPQCGAVPLPEDQLPLELPDMADFTPTISEDPNAPPAPPLEKLTDWVNTTCPACGGQARRETNTMPQWAGSCWYYLRYLDPKNANRLCDPAIEKYWLGASRANPTGGVDLYVGGAEHAVLHLLYSRFWHKVLYDLGYVSSAEPFGRLFNQGMIRSFAYRDKRGMCVGYDDIDFSGEKPVRKGTGEVLVESVEKMSKSLKNVVNPDEVIGQYGADTLRLYEMFMGPLEASKPWNTRDVPGVHRFLQRSWRMLAGSEDMGALLGELANAEVEVALHKLIKKVGEDIEAMKFNTAIAVMMEFINLVYRAGTISKGQAERYVLLLAPFAPHLGEELWSLLGHGQSLSHEPWPGYDESLLAEDTVELPVQINGKMRGRIVVGVDLDEQAVLEVAIANDDIVKHLEGKTIVKKIVVPGRLVNLVVK